MSKFDQQGVVLLSTTTVNHGSATQTTLYTTPAGQVMLPDHIKIIAAGNEAQTDITVGRVGTLTDYLTTQQLDNLDAAGDMVTVKPIQAATPVKQKTYAAGVVFQVDVAAANGNAGNIYKFFGTLKDA